ncbi:winged helix-turn-helix transcriptional regulator [Methanocella conradii]|uniref:winged helix-turn-helix transcriptional regulator n=1 Tax=Methanocella conradii TaxID=1175444 RepID=UPI00157D697A
MREIIKFIIFIFLFSSICCSANTQSINENNGGYSITTFDPQKNPEIKNNGVIDQGLTPFWKLHVYIQLTYILFCLFSITSLIYIFPFFFGRLKHALENPKTREILCFIQRNPGVTIAELSKRQNINRGTLKYHLSQLLSNDKITFIKKGKFARVFYNTSSPMDIENIISMYLKNENTRKILFKIMDNPGISNQELSNSFELAKSTTHEYIKKMSEDDILEFRQDGKFKRCYLKQDAHMVLLRYKPN